MELKWHIYALEAFVLFLFPQLISILLSFFKVLVYHLPAGTSSRGTIDWKADDLVLDLIGFAVLLVCFPGAATFDHGTVVVGIWCDAAASITVRISLAHFRC